jgi:hypothetical protein
MERIQDRGELTQRPTLQGTWSKRDGEASADHKPKEIAHNICPYSSLLAPSVPRQFRPVFNFQLHFRKPSDFR